MAAFDRVCSGILQMDDAFDNIRLGDNVVWRVDNLDEFKLFVEPYVKQAIADKMLSGRLNGALFIRLFQAA